MPKRLLVINPNTTEMVTAKVADLARAMIPGVDVVPVTARFGPRYISSRASFAIAGHAALDAYAEHGTGADAVLLACFGDPGLAALEEVSSVPIIGLLEAACAAAGMSGRRYAILTGGVLWAPMLTEMLRTRPPAGTLTEIHTLTLTGGEIAAAPEAAHAVIAEACRTLAANGAEAVIVGGAGLIGIADAIAAEVPVPLICSVKAGIAAAADAMAKAPPAHGPAALPIDSIGLSPALARLIATER